MLLTVARHPTAVDRRISRTRCTSHMATTAFGKILADLGSRLLASARVTVSRIAWRPPSPPPPWRSPPGGHVPLPFGSPSLRSPLLQTMTSTHLLELVGWFLNSLVMNKFVDAAHGLSAISPPKQNSLCLSRVCGYPNAMCSPLSTDNCSHFNLFSRSQSR
jgi:hypothetical protein